MSSHKQVYNAARSDAIKMRADVILHTIGMTIFVFLTLLFLICGLADPGVRTAGIIAFLFSGAFTWLLYKMVIKKRSAREAAERKATETQMALDDMKRRKDAIVTGVVAVTNREVEAVRQAANTVEKPVEASMGEKTCPMCAESVKAAAKKCKHCGHMFE